MILLYLLQQNISVELHIDQKLNQFLLQLGVADTASLFNILNLDTINRALLLLYLTYECFISS